ncbi:MAG: hypothetical protein QM762_14300 [Chryseolinea sp.]
MIRQPYTGAFVLCAFFVIVLLVAFLKSAPYLSNAIAGESSVGTWLSGVLLVTGAVTSLIVGSRHQLWKWYIISVFFLMLAADEHFMFHEKIKEQLIFSDHTKPFWFYEVPVLLGAILGFVVAMVLVRILSGWSRKLLMIGVAFGLASVTMDVLAAGVLIEDMFKLLAELAVACALLIETSRK